MYALQSVSVGTNGDVRYFWIPNVGDVYVIGDDGTVWSRFKRCQEGWYISNGWTRLSPGLNQGGYLHVVLCFNGLKQTVRIHQLVCEAVYGLCPPGMEVCHNDGNESNCNYWNLRYDTPKNNNDDKVQHGTDQKGERHPGAILNWLKVREIRAKYSTGKYTQVSLALEYGVHRVQVGHIVNNLQWIEA